MRRLLLCVLVLLCSGEAWAATYYVGKSGSDANSCATAQSSTAGSRKLTITSGKGCLTTAGDTLIVGDGTYVEGQISLTVSGTQGSPITIRAENQGLAILSSTSGCDPNISFSASWLVVDGLRSQVSASDVLCATGRNSASGAFVRMWNSGTPHIGGQQTSGYVGGTVKNCIVEASSHRGVGIKSNQDSSLVENCTVHQSLEGMAGVNQVFRNNTIDAPDIWGDYFTCKGGARNCQFYNNIIQRNSGSRGLVLGGNSGNSFVWDTSTGIECYNCVAYNNVVIVNSGSSTYALGLTGCADCGLYNNVFIGASLVFDLGGSAPAVQPYPSNPSVVNNIFFCNGVSAGSGTYTGTLTRNYNNYYNCTGTPTQSNPITGNPLFVNVTNDWHLQAGSPAIGTGTVATQSAYGGGTISGLSTDKENVTRTVPWSLGIYRGTASADTTAPTTPTVTLSAVGAGTVTVSWTAASDTGGVTGYTVRRCAGAACSPVATLTATNGSTLSYVDTGLSSSTTYGYAVNAFDGAANQGAFSSTVYATTTATFKNLLGFDDFGRADGADLGANWDAGYTGLQPFKIVSERVLPSVLSNSSIESYNAVATPNDQWGQATLSIYTNASTAAGVLVRLANAPTFTAYECRVSLGTTSDIVEWTAGASAILATTTAAGDWVQPDKIRCEAEGTAIRFYRIRNGVETLMLSATDASIASGKVGLKNFESSALTNAQFDDFAMGGFSGTADTAPSIATVDATSVSATLTYGAVTPTWIRVETATVSLLEPIASFPAGVYTYPDTIRNSLTDSICFYARDQLNAENPTGACDATVLVVDTTAPTMTNTTPTSDFPSGTTTVIATLPTDEPAQCRYDTADIAYGEMTSAFVAASLTHSTTVGSLTDGSTTTLYARCRDQAGNVNTTSLVITITVASSTADATAPSTVTNLVATALSSTQAELVWTAATDNVAVSGYQVYLCSGAGCTEYAIAGQPVPSTTFVVALTASTSYTFVVKAIDSSNNLSAAYSNTATITTGGVIDHEAPSTMTGLTATMYAQGALLTWLAGTDNSGLVFSIIEQCTGAGCSDFSVVTTNIAGQQLIRSLSPSTVYCFRGKHSDVSGNVSPAYSATVCGTTTAGGLNQPRASAAPRNSVATARAPRN